MCIRDRSSTAPGGCAAALPGWPRCLMTGPLWAYTPSVWMTTSGCCPRSAPSWSGFTTAPPPGCPCAEPADPAWTTRSPTRQAWTGPSGWPAPWRHCEWTPRTMVDLAADGPHMLVAGTTGSGKSELLRSMVASLVAGNRPDQLSLLLIDYKGGAAFGPCVALPHTVGVVTDLDAAETERALTSLHAELRRRERLLRAAGVTDSDAYRRAVPERDLATLPRLVIIVDEFATLSKELPDLVDGLVGVAQRGRSLGVHLVLATQRPEGVVRADIRANTNLRVCLAVTRAAESLDVLETPAAATIPRGIPGRAFLRAGPDAPTPFQ